MIATLSGEDENIVFAFAQAKGAKKRQEDSFGHFESEFFCIADGVSACSDGEAASNLAVETGEFSYRVLRKKHFYWRAKEHLIKQLFKNVSRAVYRKNIKNETDLATTFVAACFSEGWWWIGNVGDSRAYRLREGIFEQITKDHNQEGYILTRWIGMEKFVAPDQFGGEFFDNDVFLLVSDGVIRGLSDDQLREYFVNLETLPNALERAAKQMVSDALEKDNKDNITVCIVKKKKRKKDDIPTIRFN